MNKLRDIFIFTTTLFFCFSNHLTAQETSSLDTTSNKFNFGVILKGGLLNYQGDVGDIANLQSVQTFFPSIITGINIDFFNHFGAEVYGQFGRIAQSERSLERNQNFVTDLYGGGINLNLYLGNGLLFSKQSYLNPYLMGGVNFLQFSPMADLKDSDGNDYYYWSDGTIRDFEEIDANITRAAELERDYEFETNLADKDGFDKTTLGFVVGGGFDYKINYSLRIRSDFSYNFLQTDFIDGISGGSNDGYYNINVGVIYNLGKSSAKEEKNRMSAAYADVDFEDLIVKDSDGDGVLDIDDLCQDTPANAEVDKFGCPLDADNDGVPDYNDEEKDSKSSTFVDQRGVELSDSLAAEELRKDTLSILREELCEHYPSMCNYGTSEIEYQIINTGSVNNVSAKVKKSMPIEEIIIIADINKDEKITIDEIYSAIDIFFTEESKLKMNDLHHLIDYFFEQ